MDTQPILNCCPQCQTPLPADAPQGLCPKCLLAAVATPTEAGQPAGHHPAPPSLANLAAAFPQLEILEFIGQGGMGFVFKARQPKLDRLVALKILPQSLAADPTFAERFNREAKLLARLSHPGIVTVHDFGVAVAAGVLPAAEPSFQPGGKGVEHAESLENPHVAASSSASPGGKMPPSTSGQRPDAATFYYLLMEFVDGVNLRQAMQAGRFTPEQALAIVPKICEALQFAHNEGILHRDIKPENILLDAKGRVKIADFGIAKLVGDVAERSADHRSGASQPDDPNTPGRRPALHALTEAGKTLGTPNYMAPEQLEGSGEVDHRADIYSLGVVFYEMLTGELPLGRFAPPSQKSAADPRVDEVVLRALAREKTKRPASADEVRTQVETITSSAGVPPASRSSGRESAQTESPANPESQSRLTSAATDVEPRFSRMAIAGACWLAFVPLHFLISFLIPAHNWFFDIIVFLQALLFGTAPVGVTILGWIAVSQIRRSAGKLHGLWLAVFDGLLFPLLIVDAIIVGAVFLAIRLATPTFIPFVFLVPLVLGVLGVIALVDFLIIRRVWRVVNAGSAGAPPAKPPRKSSVGKIIAIGCGVLAVALVGQLAWSLLGGHYGKRPATATDFVWHEARRLNQVVDPGGSGISRYGDEEFGFEALFSTDSVALTVNHREEAGNDYQVLIDDKDGTTRPLRAIIHDTRNNVVEEKAMLSRPEFDRIAAFTLQVRQHAEELTGLSFDSFVQRVRKELSRASLRFDKLHISAVNDNNFIISFSGLEAHGVSNGKDAWIPIVGSVGSLVAKRGYFGGKWDFKGLNQLAVVRFTVTNLDLEKLLETNLAEAMPAAPTAAAQNLSFGPVVERVIQARQTGTNMFLDLDTGQLLTPPAEVTNALAAVQPTDLRADNTERRWQSLDILENTQPFRYLTWLRESGADLMFNGHGQVIAFAGTFAIAHGASSSNWDDWAGLSPEMTRAALETIGSATLDINSGTTTITLSTNSTSSTYTSAMRLFSRHGGSSVDLLTREQSTTWFFKTREGAVGILQITGFTEHPRGVKLRYKLVQQTNAPTTP